MLFRNELKIGVWATCLIVLYGSILTNKASSSTMMVSRQFFCLVCGLLVSRKKGFLAVYNVWRGGIESTWGNNFYASVQNGS